MMEQFCEKYGRFCAGHPIEVIVTTFTLTACMLSFETTGGGHQGAKDGSLPVGHCWHGRCSSDDLNAADVILMTIIRCLAILFSYHQFRNLQNLGSKNILGITGLFTIFSGFIFIFSVLNFGRNEFSDLKDALFFLPLVIDLNKAGSLAQLALNSRNQEEVRINMARGMSLLGPSVICDTLVEILLIGIGSLSGVRRLEILCSYACLGVLVNCLVFMTFYPAFLSLVLELSRSSNDQILVTQNRMPNEEDQKPNPVVERLKLIMIAGLFVVHASSRWPFRNEDGEESIDESVSTVNPGILLTNRNKTEAHPDLRGYLMNWLSVSADNIIILILLLALAVKFIFFEDRHEIARQLRFEERDIIIPRRSFSEAEMDSSLRQRFATMGGLSGRSGATGLPISGSRIFNMGGDDWIEVGRDSEVQVEEKETQTEPDSNANDLGSTTGSDSETGAPKSDDTVRSVEECLAIYKSELGANALTDREVIELVKSRHIQAYQLEKAVDNMERGVGIRRAIVGEAGNFKDVFLDVPYREFDYSKVLGACCENVVGYVPVPLGVAGPLLIDGELLHVPMATTEGCLVASTNRGCRALLGCSGVKSRVFGDGMTRGPVVRFPSIILASEAMDWMQREEGFETMKESFDETSRFARLTKIQVNIAGRLLFIRFVAKTGDAMGMNMVSKGTEKSLHTVKEKFPEMEIISLSGNFCADKKPAAVNWIEGRGKGVVCEAIIPADVVSSVLKTSTHALVDVNNSKNLVGSAVAGSIGGFNAHAANIITAIFIATGQDPAQNVGSSNCITLMEPWGDDGEDLYITCTMPCIEVGTVGGGTVLPAQGACLGMLGIKGAHPEEPGKNANKLARIMCGAVLAGELSLMAALSAGHLVRSHLRHNRSSVLMSNSISSAPKMVPQKQKFGINLTVPNVLSAMKPNCTKADNGS